MSHILNTAVAAFCHNQNHSGRVPIPTRNKAAVSAPESPLAQFQSLGSRKTITARHRRIGRLNQHHPPASPHTTLDQLPLRRTDRRIRGFTRHRGLRQKLRPEILHRDQPMLSDNTFGPHPRIMLRLPGGLLVQLRRRTSRSLIATGLRARVTATPTRHPALRPRQLRSTPLPISPKRQIEPGIGGCGRNAYAPVDTDTFLNAWQGFDLTADNERGVPMPQTVPSDTDRPRIRRQLTRPHDRDTYSLRQNQPAVTDAESPYGVFQRWQRLLPRFEPRATTPFDLQRILERACIGAQRLLLGDLRPRPQPLGPPTRFSQQPSQLDEGRMRTRFLLMYRLIPQKPAPIPLRDQRPLRLHPRTQPVVVTDHHLLHTREPSRDHRQDHTTHFWKGGRRFLSPVNGGVTAPNTR